MQGMQGVQFVASRPLPLLVYACQTPKALADAEAPQPLLAPGFITFGGKDHRVKDKDGLYVFACDGLGLEAKRYSQVTLCRPAKAGKACTHALNPCVMPPTA